MVLFLDFVNFFLLFNIIIMRKKLPEGEKKIKCSISLNKKINALLEEVIREKEVTKSTLIENLLIEHFKNK